MLLSLVIIYIYVLFCFRSNIIFHYIILYDLQYSDLFVYLIRDPVLKHQKDDVKFSSSHWFCSC